MTVFVVTFTEDFIDNDWFVDEIFSTYEKAKQYAEDKESWYTKQGYIYSDYDITEREVH